MLEGTYLSVHMLHVNAVLDFMSPGKLCDYHDVGDDGQSKMLLVLAIHFAVVTVSSFLGFDY